MSGSSYDVVVIGGGHNGLATACYLARAGLSAVVVEKEPLLGGMAISAALIPEAPGHLVSPCAFEDVFFRVGGVADELGLAAHGFREHDSAGWMWLRGDGESLLIQRDVEATVADIARFSRSDAQRYRELLEVGFRCFEVLVGYLKSHPTRPPWRDALRWGATLARDRRLRRMLASAATASAEEIIAGTFGSEAVRSVFANTILGSPFADGNGITIMNTTMLHHSGITRPVGGMGGIVAALERCLRSHGGDTLTGRAVTAVQTRGGRAIGVELSDGTALHARRAVIAACPPQRVPDLVGDEFDDRLAERLRRAPADSWGIGQLTVNVAVSRQLELPLHQARRADVDVRRPTLMAGTFESVLAAARQSMRGEVPDELPWWATIFNAIDATQAPDGQDIVDLYCPAVPSRPGAGWEHARADAADALVATAGRTLAGLREAEIGRYIETPADREERVGTPNGCIYHVDFLTSRLGPLRPTFGAGGYRTPVTGLYLTGVGTHPPAGVSGLNGKRTALEVLADVRGGRLAEVAAPATAREAVPA